MIAEAMLGVAERPKTDVPAIAGKYSTAPRGLRPEAHEIV